MRPILSPSAPMPVRNASDFALRYGFGLTVTVGRIGDGKRVHSLLVFSLEHPVETHNELQ